MLVLVVVDLALSDSAVRVDRGMHVREAVTGMHAVTVVTAAMRTPAAPVGDPPQFLDVDVDEFAGPIDWMRESVGPIGIRYARA